MRASLPYAPGAQRLWVFYEYDALGRLLVKNNVGHGGEERFIYKGNLVTVINSRGGRKTLSLDATGKLRSVTTENPQDGSINRTDYQYNALGNLKNAVLPRPEGVQEHAFTYDGGGRLLSGNRAESGQENRSYNADGTLASRTDAKRQRTAYSYDAYKRLVGTTRFGSDGQVRPEQCVAYFYDRNPFDATFSQNAQGKLAAVQWGESNMLPGLLTEMYSYTLSGKISAKRLRITRGYSSMDLDLGYAYNTEGQIASVSYPDGPILNYYYDSMGRHNLLTSGADIIVKDVSYSTAGHLSAFKQLIPGTNEYLSEIRTFDPQCHQMKITAETEKGFPLVNIEYEYSREDGRLAADINSISGEQTKYTYDSWGRLKAAIGNRNWEVGYDYDGFGNLTEKKHKNKRGRSFAARHNPKTNRLQMDTVEYDDNGNIAGLHGMKLVYDIENRLIEVRHAGKGIEQYTYDVSNRRIWGKRPDGIEDVYLYGIDGRLLATYRLTENESANIIPAMTDYNIYFANRLLRSRNEAVVVDRLGSVYACCNQKRNQRLSYLPFGEEDSVTDENRVKYGTYTRDEASGLDYAEQRYYSSELGRFISPDPYLGSIKLDDPESWNRYAYVGNDPVNRVDPHGTYYCQLPMGPNSCSIYACPWNTSNSWYNQYYYAGSPYGDGGQYQGYCPRLGYYMAGDIGTVIVNPDPSNTNPPAPGTYDWALAILQNLNWTFTNGPGDPSIEDQLRALLGTAGLIYDLMTADLRSILISIAQMMIQPNMKRCQVCGALNEASASYCSNCAAPF